MARQVYTYQPFNETPDKGLGILLPFNKDAGGAKSINAHYSGSAGAGKGVFLSSYTTEEQAISNLKNLLLTQKGERIFQPNFGTDIQRSLFENSTPNLELNLEESLRFDIEFWLPYINLIAVDVIRKIDEHTMLIKLEFNVLQTGANQEIIIYATPDNVSISEATQTTNIQTNFVGNLGGY